MAYTNISDSTACLQDGGSYRLEVLIVLNVYPAVHLLKYAYAHNTCACLIFGPRSRRRAAPEPSAKEDRRMNRLFPLIMEYNYNSAAILEWT